MASAVGVHAWCTGHSKQAWQLSTSSAYATQREEERAAEAGCSLGGILFRFSDFIAVGLSWRSCQLWCSRLPGGRGSALPATSGISSRHSLTLFRGYVYKCTASVTSWRHQSCTSMHTLTACDQSELPTKAYMSGVSTGRVLSGATGTADIHHTGSGCACKPHLAWLQVRCRQPA